MNLLLGSLLKELEQIGALKTTSIEGLASKFPRLEKIIEDANKAEKIMMTATWRGYLSYWANNVHGLHHKESGKFEECKTQLCETARMTLKELS